MSPNAVPATIFPRLLLLALVAAALATLCDANHVYTQTLAYPEPFLFGQAWWVFPNFVLAFLAMGAGYYFLAPRLPASIPVQQSTAPGNVRDFVEASTAFALVYLASGLGNLHPVLLSVIFYGTFALRWLATYERGWMLLLATILGIAGMFAEGALGASGGVAYRQVDIFHVPWWLGGLYVHGAFALREGMRFFVYRPR